MRIVCMTNEGQLDMMKNMLRSAMKSGFDMNLFHCYILNGQKEAAAYNTGEFKSITTRKLEVILHNMALDPEVIWIDNDIVLFENCVNDMRSKHGTFVMQDDLWSPCTGFFLARSGIFSTKVIRECIGWLNRAGINSNDQHAFSATVKRTIGATVGLLSQEEYPNGAVYFDQGKRANAKMVHCNYLSTTHEKIQRLKDHNLWEVNDEAFNMVNKYFI